jgi:hypothetical protein
MAPALLAPQSPLLRQHGLIGCSTGYMESHREDWDELVVEAAAVSAGAAELSAISERELPSLLDYLQLQPILPFRYISVHGPSKERTLGERELVERLASIPAWIDGVVMHPDTIEDPALYRSLGRRLVLENMDARKDDGRTAAELELYFQALPDAGLCFDIAHAKSIDASLHEGERILAAYATRLRQVHLSSLDQDAHHVPLSDEDEILYPTLLQKCRDVPWILEAPPA